MYNQYRSCVPEYDISHVEGGVDEEHAGGGVEGGMVTQQRSKVHVKHGLGRVVSYMVATLRMEAREKKMETMGMEGRQSRRPRSSSMQ